jgi:dTDP-4-dehydrorhamnose reductase
VTQAVQNGSNPLKIVDDQFCSPTWTYRLALQIREILRGEGVGTYHATSEGYCSPFECAEYVFKKLGIKTPIEPCSIKDLNRPAVRPVNCLLENRLLKKQGVHVMVDWKKDLDAFLDKFGKELIKSAKGADA